MTQYYNWELLHKKDIEKAFERNISSNELNFFMVYDSLDELLKSLGDSFVQRLEMHKVLGKYVIEVI